MESGSWLNIPSVALNFYQVSQLDSPGETDVVCRR